MKLYFASPLFSAAERAWNAEIAAELRAAGHEVFLPQEKEPGKDAAGIFATDVGGIDWAEALVAIMDGPDPDSGTAWECGYAYGKKPVFLVRTDIRAQAGRSGPYNPMLTASATDRLTCPAPRCRTSSGQCCKRSRRRSRCDDGQALGDIDSRSLSVRQCHPESRDVHRPPTTRLLSEGPVHLHL
jgi:nucleoside 2-deoxyribosyltransferase